MKGHAPYNKQKVAKRVKATMKGYNIRTATVADFIGVSPPALYSKLRGATEFKAIELFGLACVFGVTTDWLLGLQKEEE